MGLKIHNGTLTNDNVCVPVAADGTPVVEVVGKLSVTADHEIWLQSRTYETVVTTCAAVLSNGRLGYAVGPLW